jgi:hypothetical protein
MERKNMLNRRASLGLSCAAVCAVLIGLAGPSPARADKKPHIMFIQQDKVVAFNPGTGEGAQTGTATGDINGVSIVNFQFLITTFPNFNFNNRAGITDIDGDQIIFKNVGTGRFVFPGLFDPSVNPADPPYQVFANGLGGPLTGTYEVVATSGKYSHRFRIGQKFPYKGVAYNPSTPPTPAGSLGSVYVEVYGPSHGDDD